LHLKPDIFADFKNESLYQGNWRAKEIKVFMIAVDLAKN